VKLIIFYTQCKQNRQVSRVDGETKIKDYAMEEIMSRNIFVGRSGASQLLKKFFCYRITSAVPSRCEHSTHFVQFQFMSVHLAT
jgi:hypothetical protein